MKKRVLRNIEWSILIATIGLLIVGLIALYSSTIELNNEEFKKQIMWITISIPIVILITVIHYEFIAKISPVLYVLSIILLVLVLKTETINGASSWFSIGSFSFQPSEISKIFIILFLAYAMSKIQEKSSDEINRFWKLLLLIIIIAIPTIIIVMQPDYGTAIAFLVSFALMIFSSGIKKRYIFISIIAVLIIVPLLYFFVLPEHAVARINVFLNIESDIQGNAYNLTQAKLAIGSGQLFGMGITQGNQTQLGFLHPKTTDFIFSVIGEEMGFIGAGIVILLYIMLITKSIYIAKTAKDKLGSYIAIGISGMFIFHMVQNIGMTMGLLPITGVPLPFVSYGGSSLTTNFIAIALLLNISGRRQKAIFIE